MADEAAESTKHAASASQQATSWLAWSCVAAVLALGAATELLSVRTNDRSPADVLIYDVSWWTIAVSWLVVGALIAARQPRNPIGWILLALTVYASLAGAAEAYFERYLADRGGSQPWVDASAWVSKSGSAWIPLVFVPLVFLPLYFPHGKLPSPRWRVVPLMAAIGIGAYWFSEAFSAGPLYDYPEVVNPWGIDHFLVEALSFGSLLLLAAVIASVASVVVRFRRAAGAERQQIKWLAYAASLAVASLLPAGVIGGLWSEDVANALILGGVVGVTAAIGIAILRHRLYDIDKLINRTLVYGGLTVGVVAIYVAVVGGLSTLLHDRADFWLALVATGLAALLVQPLRSALQRRVNRLTYGPRIEAGAGEGGIRERLREAFVPEAAELQRARERLVSTREEERRRLRRDLHDGLGPALAGAALKVEAAQNLLAADPRSAGALLEDARSEIQDAVADVRRLVYALRPPALDELGLVGALREQAEKLGAAEHPRVEVDAPEELDGLPAAVEVAAYRISVEAMTNSARHADAHTCIVRISVNGDLEVEVVDDGRGLPDDYRTGVGIASMRERAEELGGSCEVEAVDGRGTRVRARLPLGST